MRIDQKESSMAKKEQDTEQKIKDTARIIFHTKGFAGTKTRDIAEAAGINVALLNYYFRSKKKLFDLIMTETMQSFFSGLLEVLNNKETGIEEKIHGFVEHYINLLSANPNVATFILNTIREHPDEFIDKIGLVERIQSSVFIDQFQEELIKGNIPAINPLHLLLNLMGLVVFPFIAQPMIMAGTGIPADVFQQIMEERKRLIPRWIESMLSVE